METRLKVIWVAFTSDIAPKWKDIQNEFGYTGVKRNRVRCGKYFESVRNYQ